MQLVVTVVHNQVQLSIELNAVVRKYYSHKAKKPLPFKNQIQTEICTLFLNPLQHRKNRTLQKLKSTTRNKGN